MNNLAASFAQALRLLCVIVAVPVLAQVEITYLGNEGVLLRSGTSAVLIDALHGPYLGYAAAPPEVLEAVVKGRPPYQDVQLILVSHVHNDHFDSRLVASHLLNNRKAVLASSGRIATAVRAFIPDVPANKDRVKTIELQPGAARAHSFGGVDVEFLALPHDGPRPWQELQNLGHIVSIGGLKILHVGDAKMDPSWFGAFRLPQRDIDVALLPGWYLSSPEGQRLTREQIRPRHVVAVHVKEESAADARSEIQAAFPEAAVPVKIGETMRFARER